MSAIEWLQYLALALVLGSAGQFFRVGIGLKKRYDKNTIGDAHEKFNANKLMISIALGAFAAMVTAVIKWDETGQPLQRDFMFTLMAAGYAGSDLIEGLVERWIKPPVAEVNSGTN